MNSWITNWNKIKIRVKQIIKKQPGKDTESQWTKCSCQEIIYKEDLQKNLHVCPKCEMHHKISCRDRFNITFDEKIYTILSTPKPPDDPLEFVDRRKYNERLLEARKLTNQNDATMIAKGKIKGIDVVCGSQNFKFMGGSVGTASGEAFIYGVQYAIDNNCSFIFFTSTGGQKMQEGALSLMQMPRTVIAVNELKKNKIPYIVVLSNPSTGGVTASFAMLGDIHIAEPSATVGFAGARVIQDTIKESLPEGFQTAESVLEHGGIDLIVTRKDLRDTIGSLLSILLKKKESETATENVNVDKLQEPLHKTSEAV